MRTRRSANRTWISISPPFPTRRRRRFSTAVRWISAPSPSPSLPSRRFPKRLAPARGAAFSARPSRSRSPRLSSRSSLRKPRSPPRARSGDRADPAAEVELQGARTRADPAPFSPARGRRSAPVEAEPLAPLPSFLTAPARRPSRRPRWSSPNRRPRPSVSKRRCPSRARPRRSRRRSRPCPRPAKARSRCPRRCSGAWRSPPRRSGPWGRSPSRSATAPACRP
jgi:hypothetical protein